MHTAGGKPDWKYEATKDLTRWQSIAMTTRGIVTPGNLISFSGLVMAVYGSALLYFGQEWIGLAWLLIGRIMDLLDGYVAQATKTKSHLGEIVDTTCDKVSLFIAALAAYGSGLLPALLLAVLVIHHTYMVLVPFSFFIICFGSKNRGI